MLHRVYCEHVNDSMDVISVVQYDNQKQILTLAKRGSAGREFLHKPMVLGIEELDDKCAAVVIGLRA